MSGELRVPGREPTNNPLLVLAEQCQGIIGQLRRIADAATVPHEYALFPADPSDPDCRQWHIYCRGCSEPAQRFIWPCQVTPEGAGPVPPSGFVAPPPEAPSPAP